MKLVPERTSIRVVEVMAAGGTKLVVYGNGWTRNVPEGFDSKRAEDQFLHTLKWGAKALEAAEDVGSIASPSSSPWSLLGTGELGRTINANSQ